MTLRRGPRGGAFFVVQPPSQRASQILSKRPDAITAASATRTAITKSLIASLAKCREGPGNLSMNHGLPQRLPLTVSPQNLK
jgi:hypothetical protein